MATERVSKATERVCMATEQSIFITRGMQAGPVLGTMIELQLTYSSLTSLRYVLIVFLLFQYGTIIIIS